MGDGLLRGLWKWLLVVVAMGTLVAVLGGVIYCRHLSTEIEERFSARRWHIPSQVFSDSLMLYPGQRINRRLLENALHRLRYRVVAHEPMNKGEMHIAPEQIEIFLHDLKVLSRTRSGFAVKILFSGNTIKSMFRRDSGKSLALLELEPEEIMLFFGQEREKRQLVSLDQLPEYFMHAVLAAEDHRFFDHHGFDVRGIFRAFLANLREGRISQGGSTITQQLAKSYFLTPQRTFRRKFKELLMALTIEAMYDKNEILEIYLNEIYLGQKGSVAINGVGEASYFYFGKPVSDLTLAEAAVIGGLIRGPNLYSPYKDMGQCLKRRDIVLRSMQQQNWISQESLAKALKEPVKTIGATDYGKKAPYFVDYLSGQLGTLYSPEALSSLGLSIYTTLDTLVQEAAETALEKGLARLESRNSEVYGLMKPDKRLQGAVVVLQPKTGHILALVGGRHYSLSQFNRVTQARRQPGSAFKPLIFASGLDIFTPASMLSNAPKSYRVEGELWTPQNYEKLSQAWVSMRDALTRSINRATVDLAMKTGLDRIVRAAEAFEFSTPFRPLPSVALGAFEVIPLELARAYCAFASDGLLANPLSMKAVVDEKGKVLERRHMTVERVISPAKSFILSSMLRSAVETGTARSLKDLGIHFPVAGKTGTTNEYRDAWFVGYTPDILALVWVGFDDGSSVHAPGSAAALPIWAELMKAIPQHISGKWFHVPPGVTTRTICLQSGQLAVRGACPDHKEEFFLVDNVPDKNCRIHRGRSPFNYIFRRFEGVF